MTGERSKVTEWLELAITESDVNETEVAKAVCVSRLEMAQWRSGLVPVPPHRLPALVEVLSLDPDQRHELMDALRSDLAHRVIAPVAPGTTPFMGSAEVLRDAQIRTGVSNTTLASLTGHARTAVSLWRSGCRTVPRRSVWEVAALLKMTDAEELALYRGSVYQRPEVTPTREAICYDPDLHFVGRRMLLSIYDLLTQESVQKRGL